MVYLSIMLLTTIDWETDYVLFCHSNAIQSLSTMAGKGCEPLSSLLFFIFSVLS